MQVKIHINTSQSTKGHTKSKKTRRLLKRLSIAAMALSLFGVMFWRDLGSHLAQAVAGESHVFQKEYQITELNELNQYPPVMEKAAPFVDRRIAPLREYLASKKSPLAPYADVLVNHYHYRLIIGISFAESNFCRVNIKPHNCWGIGGGRPATYTDYPQAISRADYYIQKYFDDGLTDLERFRNRWVGWQHPGWPSAVEKVARELELKGI